MPFTISIITVCLNSEEHIGDALESVKYQSRPPFELIVIDGGSTDGTNSIVEHYRDVVTHHLSEPDKGISDAMNKGLRLATGDYILFLNSDDFLVNRDVLKNVETLLDEKYDIHVFDILFRSKNNDMRLAPRCFSFWTNFKIPFCHQGVLCHRRMFETIGEFDESFTINMDYDFFLRAYRSNATVKYHPKVNVVMRDTGISSRTGWPDLRERFAEERKVQQKNCQSGAMKIIYSLYWFLYLPYRLIKHIISRRRQES